MNDISTFKQLETRANSIGYKILKVVFRGFHSSDLFNTCMTKPSRRGPS